MNNCYLSMFVYIKFNNLSLVPIFGLFKVLSRHKTSGTIVTDFDVPKRSLSSKNSGTAESDGNGNSSDNETDGAGVVGKGAKVNLQCHDT